MKKLFISATVLTLVMGGASACATKGYVRTQVSQVSSKVDTLSQSLEETQERTRKNEGRINDVDQKAGVAQSSADAANGAAKDARGAADAANGAAMAAGSDAKAAAARAEEVDKNAKRLVYTVVLSEDQGNFKFNSASLPDSAKARIDELVAQLNADPKGAYFEIEGHTDNSGDDMINKKIGMERADAVKMYLYEHHQVPLHKMNIVSYGEEKPVAPNTTKDGRAKNRRVVIRVLI